MPDELRDAIFNTIRAYEDEGLSVLAGSIVVVVEEIIAPILADAEKWRVLEKKYPNFCKRFDVTIDALEGEGVKG